MALRAPARRLPRAAVGSRRPGSLRHGARLASSRRLPAEAARYSQPPRSPAAGQPRGSRAAAAEWMRSGCGGAKRNEARRDAGGD